jgi:hypothetical protein
MFRKKRFPLLLVFLSTFIFVSSVWATVLLDQPLSTENTFPYYDQEVLPGSEVKNDVYLADDIVNNQEWQINKIFVPGDFRVPRAVSSNLNNSVALHWKIYADATGKPEGYPRDSVTTPVWELSLAPNDPQVSITRGYPGRYFSNTTLTLATPFRLPPGTYWFVFYPELNWSNFGGYGRQASDTTNDGPTHVIQPRGDETDMPTEWTSVLDFDFTTQSGPGWKVPALPQQDFAFRLEGVLYDARLSVDPVSLDFGNIEYKEASESQTLTILNTGTTDLIIGSIDVTGSSADMFSAVPGGSNPCGSLTPTIAPDENCTLGITYTPTSRSTHSASLDITVSGDSAPAIKVDLEGTSVLMGTIGSQFTLTDPDLSFGIKKGKVLIGTAATKIDKGNWGDHTITFTVTKPIPGEKYYDLVIKPPRQGPAQTTLAGAFLMKSPIIDTVVPDEGAPKDPVKITGQFFGNKKPKVYIEYLKNGKIAKKSCRVTSFGMNTIDFIVPNLPAKTYSLAVETKKVGLDKFDFKITGPIQ